MPAANPTLKTAPRGSSPARPAAKGQTSHRGKKAAGSEAAKKKIKNGASRADSKAIAEEAASPTAKEVEAAPVEAVPVPEAPSAATTPATEAAVAPVAAEPAAAPAVEAAPAPTPTKNNIEAEEEEAAGRPEKTYAAFVSHYKVEAAMEARYLQAELETNLGRRVFLDSDDLHDLRLLKEAVIQSDVVILLQSARVLERPWCLIELQTALAHGVPVVAVALTSGANAYDFTQSAAFVNDLEAQLAWRNPGAAIVLEQNEVELSSLAWQLSSTLPATISVGFNPSASRNVLRATIEDIVAAMKNAVVVKASITKDEWDQRRALEAKEAGPASSHQPASHQPTSGTAVAEKTTPAVTQDGRPATAPAPAHNDAAVATAAAVATPSSPAVPMAAIPPDVPELPASLQTRPALLAELKRTVLSSSQAGQTTLNSTTAVVGVRQAAAAASARGMGGVGKTVAAAQLMRDVEVGASFEKLLWASVSMEPDTMRLLGRLHAQLKGAKLPSWVEGELDAVQEVRSAAKGVKALLVLDDCWELKHAELLNVVDAEAGSACLITTRIRNLTTSEVSCGLLSKEEAVSLLLSTAGLEHLIEHPPHAALEAVECCGRLALALPIAGGMIRELEELWEAELVPMLKDELGAELSVEERLVNASLRLVDPSQRQGVESLFEVFGCFEEDAVVPAAALDLIAPIVCERAGLPNAGAPRAHLKVRKWLAALLKASLLLKSGPEGMHVHDLVRDVMIARVAAASSPPMEKGGGGAMTRMQRDVLSLLLDAYDDTAEALKPFVAQTVRHHVSQSRHQQGGLRKDALLMRALGHRESVICASSVNGIGLTDLMSEITDCEAAGCWLEAAQLWYAAGTLRGQRAGNELKRAWAAIDRAHEASGSETAQSRALETRVLGLLMFVGEGGYAFGSAEHDRLSKRTAELTALASQEEEKEERSRVEAAQAKLHGALNKILEAHVVYGLTGHVALTPEVLAEAAIKYAECTTASKEAALAAPDVVATENAANLACLPVVIFPLIHLAPSFDADQHAGVGGASLRANIERYDFASRHIALKTAGFALDQFLYAHNETGLLLLYGDAKAARQGWAKQIDAWARIQRLVASGERTCGEYPIETMVHGFILIGGMLAAGEMGMLRQLLPHTFGGIALRDDGVATAWAQAMAASPFAWTASEGHCFYQVETLRLQARALAVLAGDNADDESSALRSWLPSPAELIYIAEHEHGPARLTSGAAHPSLLCASLYADRLGAWAEAASVADGLLAIPAICMNPLTRIEAWRLLARCHGARADTAAARAALEAALQESRAVRYVWMEQVVLREVLHWAEAEPQAAAWQAQLEAAMERVIL